MPIDMIILVKKTLNKNHNSEYQKMVLHVKIKYQNQAT